ARMSSSAALACSRAAAISSQLPALYAPTASTRGEGGPEAWAPHAPTAAASNRTNRRFMTRPPVGVAHEPAPRILPQGNRGALSRPHFQLDTQRRGQRPGALGGLFSQQDVSAVLRRGQ